MSQPPADHDTDRTILSHEVSAEQRQRASGGDDNLMLGMLAVQTSLISGDQFLSACSRWMGQQHTPLDHILIAEGWLSEADAAAIRTLLRSRASGQQTAERSTDMLPDNPSGPQQTIVLGPLGESRLKLSHLHSSGGIGRVWLARDEVLNRDIAVKELLPEQAATPASRSRFAREAQITAQLTHPGTVPVYDYVDDGTRHFYTMKFVQGQTLTEVISAFHQQAGERDSDSAVVGLNRLLNQFLSVCRTVAYAHSCSILHRDLKPDNIVVGDFGEVVLLDWGLAKQLDGQTDTVVDVSVGTEAGNTIQGERLGTPGFMAPEQALGRVDQIDYRTDVYGLCAVLYEILTGQPPFQGQHVARILADVVDCPPQSPGKLVDWVPRELEQICLQGLAKDPDERQPTAEALMLQIDGWMMDQTRRKRTAQMREHFFGLSLDLLAVMESDGRIREASPAWETVLGWPSSDVIGRNIKEYIHPEHHEQLAANLSQLACDGPLISVEHRVQCQDDTWKWVSWNASLLPDQTGVYIVGRDIQSLKLAEARFAGLLESAPDAMVIVNTDGEIQLVNRQTERLFGYDRAELFGQPVERLIPVRYRPDHPSKVQSFVADPHTRPMGSGIPLSALRKDGSEILVEISLSPVPQADGLLICSAIREVVRDRQAEESQGD
ncbi:MAG: PAS domain S-box protein [Planctomycetaceae bacterium]|nr:PAS domain S-box protein [Planctomycetaceae bacterium]